MPYRITELCTNCGECLKACPLEAILREKERPRIDADLCTDCGTCSDICPARAIVGEDVNSNPDRDLQNPELKSRHQKFAITYCE